MSANLGNDHGFIIKEYYLHWCEAFWGSPKQSHESLCSKWTISCRHCGEWCSSNRPPYAVLWKKLFGCVTQLAHVCLNFYERSILLLFSEWIHWRMLHEEGLYIWIYRQCWNCCCHEGPSSTLDRWTVFSSGWRLNFSYFLVTWPCIDSENNFPVIDD